SQTFYFVKLNSSLSHKFQLTAGVRQGGVFSPSLFAIFVDDVLEKLQRSSLGCRLKGLMFNAIMYADDLLLLSSSITDLQKMVNLCVREFEAIDLSINLQKSCCVRIGYGYKPAVANICINNAHLIL